MENPAHFDNQSYQNINVQAELLTQLKNSCQQFPDRFPKSVYALDAIDDNMDGQWEHCLRRIKKDEFNECIVLIPYNLGDSHWIGVLIKFNANNQIELAEYIDPVTQSKFAPDTLQSEIDKVYPDVILRAKHLKKHDDQNQSAVLTVKNLIAAAEQAQLTEINRLDMDHLQGEMLNDSQANIPFDSNKQSNTWEKASIFTSISYQGNEKRLIELELRLKEGLERQNIENTQELSEKIQQTEQWIKEYQEEGRTEEADDEKKNLSELQNLEAMVKEISALKSAELISGNSDESKLHRLEEELEKERTLLKIRDVAKLPEIIKQIEQRIKAYEKDKKIEKVERETNVLIELRNFQAKVNQIRSLKMCSDFVQDRQSLFSEGQTDTEIMLISSNLSTNTSSHFGMNDRTLIIRWKEEECLITEKNLKNMNEDLSSMPVCLEKSILCLLYYISLKLIDSTIALDHTIKVPENIDAETEKEFECLKQRLKIEEFQSTEIENWIQTALFDLKRGNWNSVFIILKKLSEKISPLNIQEIFRLVEKVDEATHLIEKKDIILFLGGTGSGKSSTIHFLAGSRMIETEVLGLYHIAPTEVNNCDLREITTSPFARSETRYLTPVTINIEDISKSNNDNTILCDTPGFEDTNGAEIDIVNGISIVRAIKRCNSVKPVVLISYKSIGDRFEGLKNLTHLLAGFIPDIRDHVKAFSYLFTKYPQNERSTIPATLQSIKQTMNNVEKSDISFMNFFNDMLQKTRSTATVVDLINGNPQEILDELLQSTTIHHPDEVFHFSITEKSKAILQKQITKHQLSIMSATKRFEYLLVEYKLDHLKSLYELLDQNYIAQVYDDCVRYINKHLAEEYQEGISALNRCLHKQTSINTDDIKQYQMRISHAQLAEKLRNKHLGKEAIHSSAFIQYLNQQVDIMLENIREKDINDFSINICLNKVKLLANTTPDIDHKYTEVCQLLPKKLNNLVESFKSSVLDNKFDNSANEITKLSEALTSLQDHLDSKAWETKCIHLKDYFLKYLKDSVRKLDNTLAQEKIEENDIDSLSTCLCMLQFANNTFTLQPHISKVHINEIYEDFLSKIVNHFQDIVQKIDTQFQTENSFQTLEKLVKEMVLIRTIPAVKIRTNSDYYSIFDKLVRYIQNAGRNVQKAIETLSQREGKVNYNTLAQSLLTLNHAKWIEDYRADVYLDLMKNIEEQIIQYVEELKKSIMDVNLDLDSSDKIEHIYRLVSEINDMRPLEKIVKSIDKHIQEVNSWFKEIMNNTILIIKNTFSSEKFEQQKYQNIDFKKVEKAFHYLDACKNIRLLFASDFMSVRNDLEQVIRDFSHFIENQMDTCFEIIKHYQNENRKDLFMNARILCTRLQEISEIKKNYSRIFSYFSKHNIIEHWQDELFSYLCELLEEMEQLLSTQQTGTLNTKLLVIKALKRLDVFIDDADNNYDNAYKKYQNQIFAQTKEVNQKVLDFMKTFDYERVKDEMQALQTSDVVGEHLFKQAKRDLNLNFYDFMEETKSKATGFGNNITTEGIRTIIENLKQMENAKKYIKEYLDSSNEIDECIAEVKILIGDQIKHILENVKALINIYDFSEANKKTNSVLLMRTMLQRCCTQDVISQLDEIQKIQNDAISAIVNKYSKMNINEYILHQPKDIFEKFELVTNTNPIYNRALNSIKEAIMNTFREEIEKAKDNMVLNSENIYIKRIEAALNYLPETMKATIESEFDRIKTHTNKSIQDSNTKLNSAVNNENPRNIKIVLQEFEQSEGMQFYVNKGRELILKKIEEIVLKINENIDQNNIKEALAYVKKLNDYKIELDSIVNEIAEIYLEIQRRIKHTFQQAYFSFTNQFLNVNISTITNQTSEIAEKSCMCLIEFMKFKDDFRDQSLLIHILPNDFEQSITKLIDQISDYVSEHKTKCTIALEKMDIPSIKDILSTICKWNPICTRIEEYEITFSNNDTSVNTLIKFLKELSSYSHILGVINRKLIEIRKELKDTEFINEESKRFSKDRDQFYLKLNEKFSIVSQIKMLNSFNINIDLDRIEKDCLESFEIKIMDIFFNATKLMEKFLDDPGMLMQEYDSFNMYYGNLISFKQGMGGTYCNINEKIEQIYQKIFNTVEEWERSAKNRSTVQDITMYLINMKCISNNISSFKVKINERIDEVLNYHKKRKGDTTSLQKLATVLNQDKNGVGPTIIAEHRVFQGYALSVFNEKIQRHGLDYVLAHLKGDSLDKDRLKSRYDEYHTIYQSLIEQYLKPNIELDRLILDTKLIAGNMKQDASSIEWDAELRNKIPRLTAHIFALWTLMNAENYFEAVDVQDQRNYLLQPHAAQVISIFRVLGVGDRKEELKNNLVQIGTGEGKSLTLGVTASIFALLGFDVRCACYSDHLSSRDYTTFQSLFDYLGLLKYIHYGTFNKLCEDIINENGAVREKVEQLIFDNSSTVIQNSQQIKRAKILLIDEVDVFFSRDFYGNVYTPSASLRDPTITSLVNYIWKMKSSKLNLQKIKITVEYKTCCERFPDWEALLDEAIKDMLFDVNNFQSHHYVVNQDKIGYLEQSNTVYNVVYGYKTLFAYYFEYENSSISKASLEENICMNIKCGSFSYAEIPLQFKNIMGVTGTLETLSDSEKRVIQDVYKFKKNTFIPSVFGINNLKFVEKDDITIENDNDYFNVIRREINDRLKGKSTGKRAVLVIFETKERLKEFYSSKALESIKDTVTYLTEEESPNEKESSIKRATMFGQITLFTRSFGRGTDFKCYDESVAANGGPHVIQTFLSEELSEEVQIKGRTARQGDQGSYSMILLERDLEKFHIMKKDIEDVKQGKGISIHVGGAFSTAQVFQTIYALLHAKRIEYFKTQHEANTKYVKIVKERHQSAQKFLSNLISRDIDSVKHFLLEENKGAETTSKSRTVCLMDATSSMNHLLYNCKYTVATMFERASEILKTNNISSDSFQLQFAVYRNYNSLQNKILQSSSWETKPDNLFAFINTIEAEGGWGNEAIEIGLWHANNENDREDTTQVILIGDAPPNTKADVNRKRQRLVNYWNDTNFSQPTYYEDELTKLASKNIPVHAFYLEQRAKESFKEIAEKTGGRCEMLDINSPSGAKILTDLVTEEILRNIGGSAQGNSLVEAYRNRFPRSHS